MAYQASYRTWRPARFEDIVGQDAIVRTLRNQIELGHTAHAYLFCGSRGTGKTSTAKVLSRALNCRDLKDGEPCGECECCRDELSGSSMDILEIDAASNNGVDEIRDLRDKIKYPPSLGKYRIFIIDEVHMLSTGAFNALLKTLEEPPAHAVFILATTEPQRLPATILSRCQRFDFKRIRVSDITPHLKRVLDAQNASYEPSALEAIALAAEGGMRDALSILDMCLSYGEGRVDERTVNQVLGTSGRAFMLELADALIAEDAAAALQLVDRMMRDGRDVQVFLKEAVSHMRGLLLAQAVGEGVSELLEITQEDSARMLGQAGKLSPERLMYIMDTLLDAERESKWVSHGRVLLEMTVMRICRGTQAQDTEGLSLRLEKLERRIEEGAIPAPKLKSADIAGKPESKPAKQEEPKPVPGSDAEKYAAMVARLKKQDMLLMMSVRKGKFIAVQGNDIIAEFEPSDSIHADVCARPENEKTLSGVIEETFGAPLGFKPVLRGAAQRVEQSVIASAVDMFGRENVQIVDE